MGPESPFFFFFFLFLQITQLHMCPALITSFIISMINSEFFAVDFH